jgi:hypothetical protein
MERIRKRKGSVRLQRFFRLLQRHHAQILKELKYYKDENDNN